MILLIDNYDSFTYNLLNYIRQFQPETYLVRNDEVTIEKIQEWQPAAFVFSPGPQQPSDHPLMYEILENFHQTTPILGICLGFQAIATFSGARIRRGPEPVHGKTSKIRHFGHPAFDGIPETFQVTRYHSLVIEVGGNADSLTITAKGETDGLPMALAHELWPLWGFQFHPEAILTEHGLRLIDNWLTHHHLHPKPVQSIT